MVNSPSPDCQRNRCANASVQFEDFGSGNAFRLLKKYRYRACCFNDDIQGTAAMCLAGLYSAIRLVGVPPLSSQTILFLGAGEAGIGIADLVVAALTAEGLSHEEARRRCWFVDFASGSPFAPVDYHGHTLVPGQANNVYIFPGVALGVIASGARRVTDAMFFAAARTLAAAVSAEHLAQGSVFPPLDGIRDISISIATAVAEIGYETGLTSQPRPEDVRRFIEGQMYDPAYESYV